MQARIIRFFWGSKMSKLASIVFCMCCIAVQPQRAASQILSGDEHKETPGTTQDREEGGCLRASHEVLNGQTQLLQTSGDPRLDAALSQELRVLRTGFQANPFFALYGGSSSDNAFATPGDANYQNGRVVFGLNLMHGELQRTNSTGYTIPIIMAHEFGHILQFQYGLHFKGKYQELQADYLAGWYMGNRERNVPGGMDAVVGSVQRFFELGDYEFSSPSHHGTPEERKQAILQGFSDYQSPLALAFKHSTSYTSRIGGRQE